MAHNRDASDERHRGRRLDERRLHRPGGRYAGGYTIVAEDSGDASGDYIFLASSSTPTSTATCSFSR